MAGWREAASGVGVFAVVCTAGSGAGAGSTCAIPTLPNRPAESQALAVAFSGFGPLLSEVQIDQIIMDISLPASSGWPKFCAFAAAIPNFSARRRDWQDLSKTGPEPPMLMPIGAALAPPLAVPPQ